MNAPGTNQHGFTLIEVLIAIAVVSILAAVAYPSYVQHGVRAHRKAAQSFLLSIANAQERHLMDARNYAFDTVACDGSALGVLKLSSPRELSGVYSLCVLPVEGNTLAYSLEARPLGAQKTNDVKYGNCANLLYDHTGKKDVSGGTGTAAACWDR